jgi:hypothetical protein
MSMYPGHRGMGGVPPANGGAARLNELLDQIRAEFESHVRQTETYEHQSKLFPRSLRVMRRCAEPWPWRRVARLRSMALTVSPNSPGPGARDADDPRKGLPDGTSSDGLQAEVSSTLGRHAGGTPPNAHSHPGMKRRSICCAASWRAVEVRRAP